MLDGKREKRRQVIFEAAYKVLQERGYKGTSMLAVAKAASASNETLYSWFGNKQGLLAAMIQQNAKDAAEILKASIAEDRNPLATLEEAGAVIVELVTGDKAIILNRAAAADVADGGKLGKLIAQHGRNTIAPMIAKVMENAKSRGMIINGSIEEVTEVYLALLIGDSQIRRVTGSTGKPSKAVASSHSQRVVELLLKLYG